ncbi:NAD(P)-binding protein [Xylaria nigripes]|nr:NAD(P)-binding protein [Xylaria nigripes]
MAFTSVPPSITNFTSTHQDTYSFISPDKIDLSGKSVFIAGASKGIGRSTCIALAQSGCSKLAIGARSELLSLEREMVQAAIDAGKSAPEVVSIHLDVASDVSVREAANKIEEAFGGSLDVLICNAGRLEPWVRVAESDPDEWWATYETNVKGTYLLNRYFIPLLLKSKTKTSILISSYGAMRTGPGASSYNSSKTAVSRLAEFIAADYEKEGLICYSLHPGSVKTELACRIPEDLWDWLVDEPELAAHTIAWLVQERRPWVNGRFVSVNWDMEELVGKKDQIVAMDLFRFQISHEDRG